mmetsp:Transcript_139120/g.444394  ORF Transcript_139120/g.444394 Transcript_139120/m.444394 type:complete len:238 (-) Transcript_139120:300-1013(-)
MEDPGLDAGCELGSAHLAVAVRVQAPQQGQGLGVHHLIQGSDTIAGCNYRVADVHAGGQAPAVGGHEQLLGATAEGGVEEVAGLRPRGQAPQEVREPRGVGPLPSELGLHGRDFPLGDLSFVPQLLLLLQRAFNRLPGHLQPRLRAGGELQAPRLRRRLALQHLGFHNVELVHSAVQGAAQGPVLGLLLAEDLRRLALELKRPLQLLSLRNRRISGLLLLAVKTLDEGVVLLSVGFI